MVDVIFAKKKLFFLLVYLFFVGLMDGWMDGWMNGWVGGWMCTPCC